MRMNKNDKTSIRLITNSDDFGMNRSVTDAIIETHLRGIMTSTTMMANMPGFDYAVHKGKALENLGIGIHFNLTEGTPVSDPDKVALLLGPDGQFLPNLPQRKNLMSGKDVLAQAKLELDAQLSKMLDNGLVPTHFDSHHHITGIPVAFRASLEVAKARGIMRARTTNIDLRVKPGHSPLRYVPAMLRSLPKSWVHAYNKSKLDKVGFATPDTKILPGRVVPVLKDKVEQFLHVLDALKPGVTEISFHPGYEGSNPDDRPSTAALRISDLEIATSEKVHEHIRKRNIQLINFNDLT